jgi:hypothetical protein
LNAAPAGAEHRQVLGQWKVFAATETCRTRFTLVGGYVVDVWKDWLPDQAIYAYSIRFTIGLVGLFGISRMPEPQMHSDSSVSIWQLLAKPVRDPNLRGLLKYITAWTFAINLAGPFFVVYLIERIQIDLGMVTVLVVISQVTNLVVLRMWGRLADRFSNKSVLAVSSPLFLLAVLLGLFALRFLRKVGEAGDAEPKVVRDELLSQTCATVRGVSTLPGVRFLVAGPMSAIYHVAKVAGSIANGRNGTAGGDAPEAEPEPADEPPGAAG